MESGRKKIENRNSKFAKLKFGVSAIGGIGHEKEGEGNEKCTGAGDRSEVAPVVQAFAGVPGVKAGKLFASYGLKVKGKIFAMFGRDRLVVKLPKERVDEMVSAGKAERFNPGHGRLMKEWAAFQAKRRSGWNLRERPTDS